jgi:MoxR-like ATPase
MQEEAKALPLPSYIYRAIADIRRELKRKNLEASDRRYRQSLQLLQAHAYLSGQHEVKEADLYFLEHVLWRDPQEQTEVRTTIRELLLGYEEEIKELLYESREVRDSALRPWGTSEERARALIEVHTKLKNILARVDQIMDKANQTGRPLDRAAAIKEEIEGIQKDMLKEF